MEKKIYSKPVLVAETFEPQSYIAACMWRATLHCGVYGNSTYYNRRTGEYVYGGVPHGTPCQNTVVTVRKNQDGSLVVTGQEVPKGSLVTYEEEPNIVWGTRGTAAPQQPSSSEIGALYSLATWVSTDVNGTGQYPHTGYVASWEDYADGGSNVS